MKLRSKNTGHVFNFTIKANQDNTACYFTLKTGSGGWEDGLTYSTLEELNEFWEDYKPKEPLIKDEKVRKAVRAWADVNDIGRVWHEYASCWLRGNGLKIELENDEVVDLKQRNYTIAELCGEEE